MKTENNLLVHEFNKQFKTQINDGYTLTVLKSNDYGMFTYFDMNRYGGGENQEILLDEQKKTFERRVKRLMKIIKQKGFNPYLPIQCCIINGKIYPIEGQHRIEVCKRLGISFYYVILPITDFETGIELFYTINNSGSKWDLTDKIVSNIKNPLLSKDEQKENQKILDFKQKYKIPFWMVKLVCNGDSSYKQDEMTKKLKFHEDSEHIIQLSIQISLTCNFGRDILKERSFVRSVKRMVRTCGYNKDFENRILKHRFEFHKGMTDVDYLWEFTKVGNKKIKTGCNYLTLL